VIGATRVVLATLPGAVEAAPPPSIRMVSPSQVSTLGGDTVTIAGANFRPATVFKLGALELLNPQVDPDHVSVVGIAPAQAAGPKDVSAEDSRGRDVLRAAITYVAPAVPALAAPLITETALAYGTARFQWENLAPYDEIQVLDENDHILQTLPGNARSFEAATGGARKKALKFKGVTAAAASKASLALALVHQCTVPPPLIGIAEPGEIEFPLFGDHAASRASTPRRWRSSPRESPAAPRTLPRAPARTRRSR